MKKVFYLILLGVLVWTVPFVTAFGFYDSSGKLRTSEDLFKSSMIVVSALAGCFALYRYFRNVSANFVSEGWTTGLSWLAVNLVLDLLILVPFANMSYPFYFASIGLRYLQIPIICVTAGVLLQSKAKPARP